MERFSSKQILVLISKVTWLWKRWINSVTLIIAIQGKLNFQQWKWKTIFFWSRKSIFTINILWACPSLMPYGGVQTQALLTLRKDRPQMTSLWHWSYSHISMLKVMLINNNFQTWLLIGWQCNCQPIRSHVRKTLLTNKTFSMAIS